MCGHATLAAAHTLRENGLVSTSTPVIFETVHSGELITDYLPNGQMQLSFPSIPVSPHQLNASQLVTLVTAFSIEEADILYIGRSLYDLVVEIRPVAFHNLSEIKYSLLREFGERGVVITCAGVPLGGHVDGQEIDSRFDFFSRCFFPL